MNTELILTDIFLYSPSGFYEGIFSNLVKIHNTFCIEMVHVWYHFVTKNRQLQTSQWIDILTRYVVKV